MANFCVSKPSVRTSNGDVRESKLFNDLLSFTSNNRKQAVQLYALIKSDKFQLKYSDKYSTDDAGEPILSTVLKNVKIKGVLDDAVAIQNIEESIGATKKGKRVYRTDTLNDYEELSKKVREFIQSSPYKDLYVPIIKKTEDGRIYLTVESPTSENTILATKIVKNLTLNEKIRQLLTNKGQNIDAFIQLQKGLKEAGIVDYENAQRTAEGLLNLIKLQDSSAGVEALPEEYAHFMIDLLEERPIIKRLLSTIEREGLAEDILGDQYDGYYEDYNGNTALLNKEAAGKLVYDAMFNMNKIAPPYRNFLERVVDTIKKAIKELFSPSEIRTAMQEAEIVAQKVSSIILQDTPESVKDFSLNRPNLKRITKQAKSAEKILEDSINKAVKKYSFYTEALQKRINKAPETSTNPNIETKESLKRKLANYQDKAKSFINKQNSFFNSQQFLAGLESFIEQAALELESIQGRFDTIRSGQTSLKDTAFQLRNIKNIINSYEDTIEDLQNAIAEDSEIKLSEDASNRLKSIITNLSNAKKSLNYHNLLTFSNFLERYFDHDIEIVTDGKTKKITREDIPRLLETAENDITMVDAWLQAAAESEDIIIKLSDKALKTAKERKRNKVLSIQKRLLAAAKKLDRRNTDFMFERHADGTLSTRYKSNKNWTQFKDDEKAFLESLDEKYGKVARGEDAKLKMAEKGDWYKSHLDEFGQPNEQYDVNLDDVLSEKEREYYDTFMDIRKDLLSLLPPTIFKNDPYKAVQITKDLWERIKSSSPETWGKQILQAGKDELITRADDTSFGVKRAITDFRNRQIFGVPIYFVNDVQDENSLSRDTVSTLLAFADMAVNYDEMLNIADYLEIGRDVMEDREVLVSKGGSVLEETVKSLGQTVKTKVKKSGSNIIDRYNDLLKSQLYGRFMNDGVLVSGEGWEIKSNKLAKVINKITSLNTLAINGLAGLAAVANDIINVNSEALAGAAVKGGNLFNAKNLFDADKTYMKEILGVIGEIGNPIKTSKLGLFIEKFDLLHEYENDVRDLEWGKSKLKKLVSTNSLYFFMHAGSHWGEVRTALAQAMNKQITSDDGTETKNLWEILEKRPIDPDHPELGYTLETIPGYTLTQEDVAAFHESSIRCNERLFGIYNQADRNALQATAVGQLVLLFRKFLVVGITRRFGSVNYDLGMDTQTRGYYISAFTFLKNLAMDSKGAGRSISFYWNQMSDTDKANCVRAAHELLVFAALTGLVSIVKSSDWDKKDNPWHRRFLAYMARRVKTEAGALTPFGVFQETWNLLKSPAAAVNTFESAGDLLDLLNPWNYAAIGGEDALIKRGRYKGHSKAYKSFMQSPFVPTNRTIYKMIHPEESIIAFN